MQTLEISGKIRLLQGQSLKGDAAPLALFALCCPFGPLPLYDVTARDYTFKSKHKMDMSPLSMDPRSLTHTSRHYMSAIFSIFVLISKLERLLRFSVQRAKRLIRRFCVDN